MFLRLMFDTTYHMFRAIDYKFWNKDWDPKNTNEVTGIDLGLTLYNRSAKVTHDNNTQILIEVDQLPAIGVGFQLEGLVEWGRLPETLVEFPLKKAANL